MAQGFVGGTDPAVFFLDEERLSEFSETRLVNHCRSVQNQLRALMRCAKKHGVPASAITEALFHANDVPDGGDAA